MSSSETTPSKTQSNRSVPLAIERLFWLVAVIQSLSSLVFMLRTKSEPGAAAWMGLSPVRIVLGLGVLASVIFFLWFLIESWISQDRYRRRMQWLVSRLSNRKVWGLSILVVSAIFLGGSYFISLTPEITEPFTLAYFERLIPLVIWATGLSLQTLIALILLRYGRDAVKLRPKGKAFYLTIFIIGAILLAWSWVVKNILPIEIDFAAWNSLGVPILEFQLLLSWGVGMLMLAFIIWATKNPVSDGMTKKLSPKRIDLMVCLLLWLGAVIIWQSIPISPNWFVSEPVPPNNEYYPTSDAQAYDVSAQLALVGEGFWFQGTQYVRRSLHAFYLTILHLIAGQNYEKVVFGQILVLALLPPLIYLLIGAIHNRISAIIGAVLILLREANSISLSNVITDSNAKLLMVDLPTALLVVGFTYCVILWFKEIENRSIFALIPGGILGLAMLVRLETFILALPVITVAGLILFPKKRPVLWTKNVLLFGMGILLVISPWIWRNWKLTGEVFIDSPIFRFALIYQRFRTLPTPPPEDLGGVVQEPDENTPPLQSIVTPMVSQPTPTSAPSVTPKQNVVEIITDYAKDDAPEFIKQHSNQVVNFIIAHDINSELQTILYLPTTFRALDSLIGFIGHRSFDALWYECCSAQGYVRRMPYWHKWNGQLPRQAIIPLTINILLFAAGIHISWKKEKFVGITPLLLASSYLLFNAIFRNSGGRYILPVDWTGVLYFSIGLSQISIIFIDFMTDTKISNLVSNWGDMKGSKLQSENKLRLNKLYLIAIGFFLIGCSIPALEKSLPELYSTERRQMMLNALEQSELLSQTQSSELHSFLSQGGVSVVGRALYPRYFLSNTGDLTRGRKDPLNVQPFQRLTFFLAGPHSNSISMPLKEKPTKFPNAIDVIVVSCPNGGTLDPLAIATFNPAG